MTSRIPTTSVTRAPGSELVLRGGHSVPVSRSADPVSGAAGGWKTLGALPVTAAVVALTVGLLAAAGWVLGVDGLKSIVPGTVTMKINTALSLVALGTALWLVRSGSTSRWAMRAADVLLLIISLVAGLTLVQYIASVDFGIDQALFREPPGVVGTITPGRMSPQTGLSFILLSVALAFAARRRRPRVVVALVTFPLGLAALNLMDRFFDASAPTFLAPFTQMAVPTSVAFLVLAVGIPALYPKGGPLDFVKGDRPAAQLSRRLLVAAFLIPTILSWVRLEGQRAGLYDTAYGLALGTLITILLLGIVTWLAAGQLDRANERTTLSLAAAEAALGEAKRAQEEAEIARSEAEWAGRAADAARADAETANRAKSEFLSRMSHELRTPLNSVLGFSQLLELDELTADQRDSVRYISNAGTHLLGLINEVLDIARIESGTLTMSREPISIAEIVAEAGSLVRPLAEARGMQLTAHFATSDGHVLADKQRLKQILLNLLSNAVKYGRDGGSVEIRAAQVAPDRVRIEVRDDGLGIPAEKLDRLFTPFDRLGAEGSGIEGTGMGLALSRGLADAMGGSMGVQSVEGRGTTFWVELAVAEPPSAADVEVELDGDSWSHASDPRKTVLYIEDSAANVRLVERILRRRPSVELFVAGHGRLGVQLATERVPDLILLDLHLPDMSGQDVLHELRADPRTRDVPVVVLSADATEAQARRLDSEGIREFLTKPLDVARLLAVIDAVDTPIAA